MERKGGCCLAPRYAAAAAAGTGQAWQMGRIMLKFRPIAPKPAAMAPVPSPSPAPVPAAAPGRGKRKAAAGGGDRRRRKPRKAATVAPAPAPAVPAPAAVKTVAGQKKESDKDKSLSERSSSSSGMTSVDSSPPPPAPTTLPLMPVLPAEEKPASAASTAAVPPAAPSHAVGGEHVVAPRAVHPAATSWVTVEDVTATWRDGEAPSTATTPWAGDDEAPAFVSDQWGRVTWTNAAFSRAVSAAAAGDVEVRVGLAANLGAAAIPAWGTCAGFTCRVRVHSDGSPRRGGSGPVVAPCDVWRLDAGGCYLWRLDLQAALTLGGGLP